MCSKRETTDIHNERAKTIPYKIQSSFSANYEEYIYGFKISKGKEIGKKEIF